MKWKSINNDGKPKKDGQYLVTKEIFKHKIIDLVYFTLNPYNINKYDFIEYKNKKTDGIFFKYDSEVGYYEINEKDILAWCEVPEIYEGE